MSTDKQVLIDIDPKPTNASLDFQNFGTSDVKLPTVENKTSNSFQNDPVAQKYSVWSLEYFQRFFDVDTNEVVDRILGSMHPNKGVNYFQHYIQSKPDLYGPFWICVTLVFTIAISGNMANYLQAAALQKAYSWKYDFHAVSVSATFIFLYAWFVPVILWGVLKYHGSDHVSYFLLILIYGNELLVVLIRLSHLIYIFQFQLSLLELICIYGYSLSVYIPISILWVVQINIFQWALVFIGALLSGYVLMTSIKPAFGEKNLFIVFIFLCLHALLAVCFMLYFFHVPPMTKVSIAEKTPS